MKCPNGKRLSARLRAIAAQRSITIGIVFVLLVYVLTLHWVAKKTNPTYAGMKNETEENKEDKKVAITFDDGPSPVYTEKLLDGLKERNVTATFFLIGEQAENYPELVARMYEEGHTIGNHTYDHVNLCTLSTSQVKEQVDKTNQVIADITGQTPIYIRPPFGEWNDTLSDMTGMIEVLWDVDPRDWETNDTQTVVRRVLNNVSDREIILFHDCSGSSVSAALAVVDALKENGYEFVGVDEIIFD
jgi:peptidoglycan/xylan/chitin deacetylase (PgdA/CDA1 family)